MEGSAKIISLIARDENQHLALTQNILKGWREGDDPEMLQIAKEEEENIIKMFEEAVEQEREWASYLFKDGSMIGLNDKLLIQYVEWIANKRMKAWVLILFTMLLRETILCHGHNTGSHLRDCRLHHKKQKLNLMLSVVLNKTLRKTHSQDSNCNI